MGQSDGTPDDVQPPLPSRSVGRNKTGLIVGFTQQSRAAGRQNGDLQSQILTQPPQRSGLVPGIAQRMNVGVVEGELHACVPVGMNEAHGLLNRKTAQGGGIKT